MEHWGGFANTFKIFNFRNYCDCGGHSRGAALGRDFIPRFFSKKDDYGPEFSEEDVGL
jgi:hypothetical protein